MMIMIIITIKVKQVVVIKKTMKQIIMIMIKVIIIVKQIMI